MHPRLHWPFVQPLCLVKKMRQPQNANFVHRCRQLMNLTKLTMLRNVFFSVRMPTSILTSNVTLTDLYFYDLRFPIIAMCGNFRNFLLFRILREITFLPLWVIDRPTKLAHLFHVAETPLLSRTEAS